MLLSALLGPEITAPPDAGAIEVAGISADSRKLLPGYLFVAIAGTKSDGARYIVDAIAKGAAAVVAGSDVDVPPLGTVPILRAASPRLALARIAARYYEAQPKITVAVTGTSGKTSVADFTRQIFTTLGHRAASLGTIGLVKPDGGIYGSLTTPDPISLHATLASLAGEGIDHLAFEASSHGLDQHRLDGVRLTAAAFTNLGRDHLDYHPSVEEYLAAKLRLFTELLKPGQTAVVNADGARSRDVTSAAVARGLKVMTVGEKGETLRRETLALDGFNQLLKIAHGDRSWEIRLPLVGAYQAENALVAAGLAIAAGEAPALVMGALERLRGVKGRLEIVAEANGGLVIVDYAHKPEALAAALEAVRPFATSRLICVFGCGGDRDRGKRPIMGQIAVDNADITIVTDDNPRTEDPAAIRTEILAGANGAREIGDRAEAIAAAVAMIGPGDVVLIAGKGHETGQIIGDQVFPFSDHEAVQAALNRA
jgi:UDP-N-acetylmuramoyl-L-alanyl-D-glutamate--2,6-diaminopimelate ligase